MANLTRPTNIKGGVVKTGHAHRKGKPTAAVIQSDRERAKEMRRKRKAARRAKHQNCK
jgi:hypothetical protein